MLLGRHLANSLCRTVSKYECLFTEEFDLDREKVLQSRTIKEFDSRFTSKHFGFETVQNYYDAATLHVKIQKICVPLLCLSAADDPFQPLDGKH
jgi:abhydrolase domain-containing protein 1/3